MKKYVIGIDVGGTNVKLGIVDPKGKIVSRENLSTKLYIRNKAQLIQTIVASIQKLIQKNTLKRDNISGIGIGLPGLINPQKGIVDFLPNIPGWKNVPLRNIIEKKVHIPTSIDNDVNLITLAEWKFGAGVGVKNMLCITLGTGVGGGLILNNELYRGEGFVAGEVGHIPLNETGPACNCGGIACFERYIGNQRLLEKAKKVFKNNKITLKYLDKLASQGNKRALNFWEEAGEHIGNALIGVVNILNPRLIVIGGGVSNGYKHFGKTIKKVIKKRSMHVQAKMVKVVRAKLGDDAGIIGAEVLIRK